MWKTRARACGLSLSGAFLQMDVQRQVDDAACSPCQDLGQNMEPSRKRSFHGFGWFEQNECKICYGPGYCRHGLYECRCWQNVRLQLENAVRCFEQVARRDTKQWLRERGLGLLPGACLVDREVGREQSGLNQQLLDVG